MKRLDLSRRVNEAFSVTPIVALLGPRQSGKTTLAKQYFSKEPTKGLFFDLENPEDEAALRNPTLSLNQDAKFIVIDEIQRLPNLFPYLRNYVDQAKKKSKLLILGSASRELIRQSSESLAGRITYIEVTPFSIQEAQNQDQLWVRGGFPRSFLGKTSKQSYDWRLAYIRTFLEQDIPQLGIQIPATQLRRFWMMLAHYHGQILNSSELGNALQLSHVTVKKYLDILTGTFMVRQLQPWFENISKRQVKAPKIYLRDSGILHALFSIHDGRELLGHPKVGASWEGFALEQVTRVLNLPDETFYYWHVHSGPEIDLLSVERKKIGYEFKYSSAPTLTSSMITALEDLKLDSIRVVYPGEKSYRLHKKVEVLPLRTFF